MKRVLICNINPASEGYFVPLIYGMLKSFCDQYEELRNQFIWLEPVMLPLSLEELDGLYDFSSLDVVGLSCYQWNCTYQYRLAETIKAVNPFCTIIAGGPQVEWQEPEFFKMYPYIDFAVPAEGEAPFRDILFSELYGVSKLEDMKGVLINPRFGRYAYQHAPPLDLDEKPSPWLSMKDFWRRYFKKNSYYHLAATIETSRGCPHTCAYCDWGSKTNLKVRKVPDAISEAEIRFLVGELKPWFAFWSDANLGILHRDKRLAELFSEERKKSGFPLWLYYNNNKNNWRNNLDIALSFREAGLLTKYVLSLQHRDTEVLSAIERKNLDDKQLNMLIKELYRIDYPVFTQLIVGCPGDTFLKWLNCFAELMKMGVHAEYRAYPFSLLPNSPAGKPEYQAKWCIGTILRPDYVAYYHLKDSSLNQTLSYSRYVVETASYTNAEYRKMWLLCWLIQALHDHGITRFIAIALHNEGRLTYGAFYNLLFNWFYESSEMRFLSQGTVSHIDNWLYNPEAYLLKHNKIIEGMIEPEEDLALTIMDNLDQFFYLLGELLTGICPSDLLDYQRDILYRRHYSNETDSILDMPRRWVDYFNRFENDPFNKAEWLGNDNERLQYQVDTSDLDFPVKVWYKSKNEKRRDKAYYDQVIQHNVPGRRRIIFKKLIKKA